MNSRSIDAIFFALAILAGLIVSWIDTHATEVQPAVLMLLLFSAVFGFIRSRSAWRWAIILSFTLFLGDILFHVLGVKWIEPPQPNVFATLIGLIPSLIGTYAGVAARKVAESLSSERN